MSLMATSLGGHQSVVTRPLIVDETAPVMGRVGIGGATLSTAYWGVGDGVLCGWTPADDPESGVYEYAIALLLLQPAAPGVSVSERMQTVAHHLSPGSAFNVTLVASLTHGARYKCVVTAVNNAGLRASRGSSDFVVDLSGPTTTHYLPEY